MRYVVCPALTLQLGFICELETNETEFTRQLKDAVNKRISENVVLLILN